jgi:hypothetical protein
MISGSLELDVAYPARILTLVQAMPTRAKPPRAKAVDAFITMASNDSARLFAK